MTNRRRRRPTKLVKLVSSINSGTFYITSTKPKAKLSLRKFDGRALAHCVFTQSN
ncbi:MAG: 50S ribosomal protein L33 [Candidatus Hodgkinia cicadicola]